MKKTLLIVAFLISTGCSGPITNSEVLDLKAVHRSYRSNTKAKDEKDQGKVDLLGDKIEKILSHMDELTR